MKGVEKGEKAQGIHIPNTFRLSLSRMRGGKIYKDNSPEFSSTDENHQGTNSGNRVDPIKLLETTHQRKMKDTRRK